MVLWVIVCIWYLNYTLNSHLNVNSTHKEPLVKKSSKIQDEVLLSGGQLQNYAHISTAEIFTTKDSHLCVDLMEDTCSEWAAAGECERNSPFMIGHSGPGNHGRCCKSCDKCAQCWLPEQDHTNLESKSHHIVEKSTVEISLNNSQPLLCSDRSDSCFDWVINGECEKNPLFMIGHEGDGNEGNCCKSCNKCNECFG
eukprot:CAMPEP_0196577156 /NCGR_PEP_ID=MMETSP1081-20130531/6268_1 /TAXON_ID=36882 /ORGANISM="Pyramimonas amylifera, Strain CCMP720" /LENGTH=196 /DNA_ID=CAMNT_0041895989 /DNA_START=277 /DNA_END=867 /DNA_ORIENTATION=-